MIAQDVIDQSRSAPSPDSSGRTASTWHSQMPDDKEMLRAAVELTRDIADARAAIYWPDMLGSATLGYAALAGAILLDNPLAALACGLLASLALYRALLFIHELTHIHKDALPGFRFAWNLLVGIPLLIPSFMYEGVHTQHHARTRYGTIDDPEYMPLALMKPWSLPVFALTAILLPPALLVRSAVLVPLGVIVPPVRKLVWERASALSINPQYRRRKPEGAFARMVFWQELGSSVWAIGLVAASFLYGWRPLVIALCVVSLTAFLNQVRTLVAHLWENDGEAMTVTAQYLDSVNVPPPALLSPLWAPVGLRYHALHHLLPSMPYHALGECHRRLTAHLGQDSTYTRASYKGLMPLLTRLTRSTLQAK
ncbi:fatty acid desaturase family protein [Novosphingobium mangrovi (ex Huang et al. 2023)]|uniref:Fatty acid desaturase n=1 Tax=Novosphingobium mangrovi (ex Huang et al. 2023) TaxID=2976432 RepID=A0ABT2HZK5_9SPHN|nr:fatty acid desaturase [Novosphingobium mangrovi (ex Huang et al. 2023)]MCT2397985.1 fatty acid desaturase [Novosphingobium mangrovi (ex Huang et al. 2023)]